jgi:hypothetical protein
MRIRCRRNPFTEHLPSGSPVIVEMFTCRCLEMGACLSACYIATAVLVRFEVSAQQRVCTRQYIVAYLRHTRSRDYATVDEAVFSPCRAEPSSVVPWRVARRVTATCLSFPCNNHKHFYDARVWRGHVTASAVTSRVSTVTQQLKSFPRVRSRVYRRDWSSFTRSSRIVLCEFSVGRSRVRFVVEEDFVWAVVSWVRENNSGAAVRIPQFKLVLGVSCEECVLEEKIYV